MNKYPPIRFVPPPHKIRDHSSLLTSVHYQHLVQLLHITGDYQRFFKLVSELVKSIFFTRFVQFYCNLFETFFFCV